MSASSAVGYRWRERTFPYFESLPYPVESQNEREAHLRHIIKKLYISVKGDDLKGIVGNTTAPALAYWTRELRSWTELKFDMPLDIRIMLVRFYFSICTGGIDGANLDLMINMYCYLAKDESLVRNARPEEIGLDWVKITKLLRKLAFPLHTSYDGSLSKAFTVMSRLALVSRNFVGYEHTPLVLEQVLPMFHLARSNVPHNVLTLLMALLPVVPLRLDEVTPEAAEALKKCPPQDLLPTLFQIWSLNSRSHLFDFQCLDAISGLVGDCIAADMVPMTRYGMMTKDQLSVAFVAILRMLEVPVSYVGSPYVASGASAMFKSDKEKRSRIARAVSTFIICSMAGDRCLEPDGIMDRLEYLMHSIQTFCHPSNQGPWSRIIITAVSGMIDLFSLRWNAQQFGESIVPKDRWITAAVKTRFVNAVSEVTFLGIHSKSSTVSSTSLECLQGLAMLEPDLVIPRVLKEVYPSLEGLLETHRTIAALNCLTYLARPIALNKRYAVHLPTLIQMAIPGIDANDLTKTLHTLAFIQSVALSVPFYDLTKPSNQSDDDMSAIDCVSNDLNALSEDIELPKYSDVALDCALRHSTKAFEEFVTLFLGRIFLLLENLPDLSGSAKNDDLPEVHVINSIPPTLTAVLGACSSDIFARVVNQLINFISNNIIYSATDAIAHICACLVSANSKVAFNKLFPILASNIKFEIEENGAGSTRSGSEILPRDRPLIWYLSCLNMALSSAGKEVLNFKKEIFDITLFLRDRCRGHIIYHISNTLHHALMTLTMTSVSDFGLIPEAEQNDVTYIKHWGRRIDWKDVKNIKWHIPSAEEVSFAVELYSAHCRKSFELVSNLIDGTNQLSSVTEFSDITLSSLTFIRTASSGISILFDSRKKKTKDTVDAIGDDSTEDDEIAEQEEGNEDEGMEFDEDFEDAELSGGVSVGASAIDGDDDWDTEDNLDIVDGKLRKYPANYFFGDKLANIVGNVDDEQYKQLHEVRDEVGHFLHKVHQYLAANRENDFSSFKSLMFAYKVWFSDVGIERSARPLDCMIAMYTYETKNFRISGLRKDYPRPILARRANLYHTERLAHNVGPRLATPLEKLLVNDVLDSVMSIYPDIHRNAQSALDSAAKVLIRGRHYMYPALLKATNAAFDAEDYKRGESGLKSLKSRVLNASIKKDYKNAVHLMELIVKAIQCDYPGISDSATELFSFFATNLRLPLDIISLDMGPLENLTNVFGSLTKDDTTRIAKMKKRKANGRLEGQKAMEELVKFLADFGEKSSGREVYWKYQAGAAAIFTALCASPQMPVDPRVLISLCHAAGLHQHPGVKAMSSHAFLRILNKLMAIGYAHYDWKQFLLDFMDGENQLVYNKDRETFLSVAENRPDFRTKFLAEMGNLDNPSYFVDRTKVGWLVWPEAFIVEKLNAPPESYEWNTRDRSVLEELGQSLTPEWIVQMVARHCEEPRQEHESLNVMSITYFKMIFMLVELKFTPVDLDFLLQLVTDLYASRKEDDKNIQRCVAELCVAILEGISANGDPEGKKLSTVEKILIGAFNDDLSQETLGYWRSFAWLMPANIYLDYRRVWPILELVNDYKISEDSNASFKLSSKLSIQRRFISSVNWYYRPVEKSTEMLWGNIAHNFKGVRDEIGKTLAAICTTRVFLGYDSVESLIAANKAAGSLGIENSFVLDSLTHDKALEAFEKLEEWRKLREPGDTSAKYVLAAKTISIWLSRVLKSCYGTILLPLIPNVIIPASLHFLNVRDDSEITLHAVELFNMLGNLPYPMSSIQTMVDAIVEIGTKVSKWHQRVSLLNFTQAFFFRQMFIMSDNQRHSLVDTVIYLLSDSQLEVRELAADTLSGMVRCSSRKEQDRITRELQTRFTSILRDTQKLRMMKTTSLSRTQSSISLTGSGTATPTGTGLTTVAVQRHSAVLGLGALVKAFPYVSPPPPWVPEVLATLAVMASGDSGMVGKSVKSSLSDFKKTRQDTWHIDSKAFTAEQLDDLDGVLWKNYFV